MSPPHIPITALLRIEANRSGTPLAGRAEARSLLPQIMPGQVLSARVDAVLPEGNFRVTVAGQPLAMGLPKYFAPGDTLELVFVAREPRLTFALRETPQAAAASVVSSAGRLVATVLPQPGEAAMPAGVANAAPLLPAAPEDGAGLSTQLQSTLTQSGLFYESHQAEWVAGRRELAALLREPQAHLIAPSQQQAQQSAAAAVAAGTAPGIAPANELLFPAAAAPGERPMPQQVQAVVQQQLAALETGKLAFQLQVWPDQWMKWEIDAEAHSAGGKMIDAPQRLQTRLHLDLPRLGELDAALTFDATGVHVRLAAAKASSTAMLQDHRASLRAALAGAGMSAVDIAVTRHGTV